MDVFNLHKEIISDYSEYVKSFIEIKTNSQEQIDMLNAEKQEVGARKKYTTYIYNFEKK